MNQNPWRYDGELFLSLPISIDEKRRMAVFELKSANKQLQIYSRNYTWYQSAIAYGMLSYIKMNMRLYKNLINQMNMRADAAVNGHLN